VKQNNKNLQVKQTNIKVKQKKYTKTQKWKHILYKSETKLYKNKQL
jgi:hypothetical protein